MPVFVYPNSEESIVAATEVLAYAALPSPILWDHACLELTVRDLIQTTGNTERSTANIVDIHISVERTGILDPVILFYGEEPTNITTVIRQFKRRNQWPLLAVVTKTSLDMTLACLITHLLDDREKELEIKAQRQQLRRGSEIPP